jgi:hypothetical protein
MEQFLALQAEMLALQRQQAEAMKVQVERTAPRENPNYVAASDFLQPDGEPWAKTLPYEIFFGPILLNKTPLTQKEVTALRRIGPRMRAPIVKVDGSVVLATVTAREDAVGRIERLTIELPLRRDSNPMHYPSLVALADQLAEPVSA